MFSGPPACARTLGVHYLVEFRGGMPRAPDPCYGTGHESSFGIVLVSPVGKMFAVFKLSPMRYIWWLNGCVGGPSPPEIFCFKFAHILRILFVQGLEGWDNRSRHAASDMLSERV